MAKLYSLEQKQWFPVPDDEVEGRLRTGQWVYPKGTSVNVKLGDGTYKPVDQSELGRVFAEGGGYDTVAARAMRHDQAEYEGKGPQAMAWGVARGLSFGVSDFLHNVVTGDEEYLQKLEEHNTVESLAGEGVGVLLPAVLTGGGTLAAKAALMAGKTLPGRFAMGAANILPSVYTAKLGHSTAAGVSGILGQATRASTVSSKTMKLALPMGVSTAVETGIYGVHQDFSEEALGRPDTTSDELLASTVGWGFGGAVAGAAMPGLGKAFGSLYGVTTDNPVTRGIGRVYDYISGAMHGLEGAKLRETLDDPDKLFFVAHKAHRDEVQEGLINQSGELVDDMLDSFDDMNRSVFGEAKRKKLLETVDPDNFEAASSASTDKLAAIAKSAGELLESGRVQDYDVAGIREIQAQATSALTKIEERLGGRGEQIKQVRKLLEDLPEGTTAADEAWRLGGESVSLQQQIDGLGESLRAGATELDDYSRPFFEDALRGVADRNPEAVEPVRALISAFQGRLQRLAKLDAPTPSKDIDAMNQMLAQIDEASGWNFGEVLGGRLRGGGEQFGEFLGLQAQRQKIDDVAGQLHPEAIKDSESASADVFIIMDSFKRHLSDRYGKYFKKQFDSLSQKQKATYGETQDAYGSVRELLEDEGLWGKAAADVQREINAPFHEIMLAWKQPQGFVSRFTMTKPGSVGHAKPLRGSRTKIGTFVKNFGDQKNNDREFVFGEFAERYGVYAQAVAKHYGEAGTRAGKVVERIASTKGSWDDFGQKMDTLNYFKPAIGEKTGLTASDILIGGGGLAHGGMGALPLAYAAKGMTDMGHRFRRVAFFKKVKMDTQARLHKAVDNVATGMMTGKEGGWEMSVATGGRRLWAITAHELGEDRSVGGGGGGGKGGFRAEALKSVKAIQKLNSPNSQVNFIQQQTKGMEEMPKLQAAMSQKLGMLVTYAANAMPPTMSPYIDPVTGEESVRASDADLRKFVGVLNMLEDPIGTLADGMNRNTLTAAQIQAAQSLYPELFNKFVFELHRSLNDSKAPVSYGKRIQLSSLTGMPMTPYMEQGFIAAMQAVHGKPPTGAQQPRGYTGALSKQPERELLPLQRGLEP